MDETESKKKELTAAYNKGFMDAVRIIESMNEYAAEDRQYLFDRLKLLFPERREDSDLS